MGKSDAGEYPTTKASSEGLYGSSTTNAGGTTYSPTDFEKNLVDNAKTGMLASYNNYMNPTASSDLVDSYNNQYTQDYNNNYLNPALTKGLLRGSTAADIMRGAETDYKNNRAGLIDAERSRQLGNLQTSLLAYTTPYDMMRGTAGLSQSLANSIGNYNLTNADLNNEVNAANWSALTGAVGNYGGGSGSGNSEKAMQLAQMMMMASDIKIKKNIKKIDEKNGINIYEFEYKTDEYPELPEGKHIGVIAQEVEHIPNAVIDGKNYKIVNYNIIDQLIKG